MMLKTTTHEDELLVAVHNVDSSNAHQAEFQLFAEHDGVVAIGHFFKLVFRVEIDLAPRHDAWLHLVLDLEQDDSIS